MLKIRSLPAAPGRDLEAPLGYTCSMALRQLLGCLVVATLVVGGACGKDKGAAPRAQDLPKRCEQLAKACSDTDKHIEKLTDECKQVAPTEVQKGCVDKALAAYDCYEKEICGGKDKVWTLDDLRVLAERHAKCAAETKAARECVDK